MREYPRITAYTRDGRVKYIPKMLPIRHLSSENVFLEKDGDRSLPEGLRKACGTNRRLLERTGIL